LELNSQFSVKIPENKIYFFCYLKNLLLLLNQAKKGGDNGGWGKLTQKINKMQKTSKIQNHLKFLESKIDGSGDIWSLTQDFTLRIPKIEN
jgi:hypothetical protein